MTKNDDALARAVAAVRVVAVPRARLMETERADERRAARRQSDAKRRELNALRDRLAAVASEADEWFRRWVRAGRLKLTLHARPDAPRSRIELPRFYITDAGAVWHREDRRASDGLHRWYDFALGAPTHSLRGGLSGIKFWGGIGGDLGKFRNLAELARRRMRHPPQQSWDGMHGDVLRVGLRVAHLLRSGELEPLLVGWLHEEAEMLVHVTRRAGEPRR